MSSRYCGFDAGVMMMTMTGVGPQLQQRATPTVLYPVQSTSVTVLVHLGMKSRLFRT
jgi:hypothetical protein